MNEHTTDSSTLTLKRAIELFTEGNQGMVAPGTIKYHRFSQTSLLEFLGDDNLLLDDLNLEMLVRWRQVLFERRLAKPTVDSYIRSIRRLFNWLNENELYQGNPAKKLKSPRLPPCDPKAMELADLQKTLAHMAYLERFGLIPAALLRRDRAMILFLADTGCRVGGLVSLNLESIDLDAGRALVAEKGRGGKKKRLVFMSDKTTAAVRDWLYFHPEIIEGTDNPQTPVFVSFDNKTGNSQKGSRLKESGAYWALDRRAKAAGVIGRFNPHSFRHAAAREWIRNGADLSTVSSLLGHESIEITAAHYARWTQEELKQAHNKFGFIGGDK